MGTAGVTSESEDFSDFDGVTTSLAEDLSTARRADIVDWFVEVVVVIVMAMVVMFDDWRSTCQRRSEKV